MSTTTLKSSVTTTKLLKKKSNHFFQLLYKSSLITAFNCPESSYLLFNHFRPIAYSKILNSYAFDVVIKGLINNDLGLIAFA